jgi:peptidoglycan/xylan/chitin deacetylase (PgdA/CDA1 family)
MTWGTRKRVGVVLLLSTALVIGLAACASSAPRDGQWVNAAGATASPSETALPPGDDASPEPSASANPSPSKKSASPSPSKSASKPPGDMLARVPKFGPRPAAKKIKLPGGDSAAWLSKIPTDQPVAFLTIDDGWVKRPEALALFKRADIPVTLFLTINAIKDNPGYFQQLRGAGAVIEAHTVTHTKLKGQSYDFQKREVCGSADQLQQLYGRRPVLFRPPFGEKDDTTLKVVRDCGMRAAFFWKETVDLGVVRYQSGSTVQRGDILLMHFRERFVDDFIAALQAIKAAGLTPALLEDYIPS